MSGRFRPIADLTVTNHLRRFRNIATMNSGREMKRPSAMAPQIPPSNPVTKDGANPYPATTQPSSKYGFGLQSGINPIWLLYANEIDSGSATAQIPASHNFLNHPSDFFCDQYGRGKVQSHAAVRAKRLPTRETFTSENFTCFCSIILECT
jgi:hypothetical protein